MARRVTLAPKESERASGRQAASGTVQAISAPPASVAGRRRGPQLLSCEAIGTPKRLRLLAQLLLELHQRDLVEAGRQALELGHAEK